MPETITIDRQVYFSEDYLIKAMVKKTTEYSFKGDLYLDEMENDRLEAYQDLLRDLEKKLPGIEKKFAQLYLKMRYGIEA